MWTRPTSLPSPDLPRSAVRTTLRILVRVAAWPWRVAAARRVLGSVSAMSDVELKDIGLCRHDLYDAWSLPRDVDPGRLFQARADERRAGRQPAVAVIPAAPPKMRKAGLQGARPRLVPGVLRLIPR